MDLILAKDEITRGDSVFAAYKDGKLIFKSKDFGVKPALDFLSLGNNITKGSSIADRVIGKGSAMIVSLTDCSHIYGGVVSKPARDYLEGKEVKLQWKDLVDNIINKRGDDICPVEKLLVGIHKPEEGLETIKKFIESMRR